MTALAHSSRRAQPRGLLAKSDEWQTPPWLFKYASKRYGPFALDAAAAAWNFLCARYHAKDDHSLERTWARRTWCNPPYSRGFKEQFLAWGRRQVLEGLVELVCFLVPHDTSDGYWRRTVEAPMGDGVRVSKEWNDVGTVIRTSSSALVIEKTELHHRLRYQHNDGSKSCRPGTARHSSALVVFARPGVLRPLVQASGRWRPT